MALSPIVGILICTVSSIYAQQLWNFNQQEFQEPQFPAQFRNFQEPQQVASSSQAHVVRTPQQQQQFSQQQQQQFTQQQQQQFPQQQQQFPQEQQQQFTQQQQQFPQQQQFSQQQQQQFPQEQQQQFTQQQQQEFPQQFNNRPQDFAPVTHSPHTPESQQVVKKPPVVPNFRRDLPPPPPAQFMPDKATLHTIRRPHTAPRARQRRPFLVQHTITRRPFQPFVASNVTEIHTVSHVSTTIFTTSHTTTAFPTLIPTQAIIRRPNFGRNTTLSKSGKDPNKYFLECCKKKKVEPKCESRCNFEVLSKKVLTGMFIGSDVCPNSYGIDLFSCAAQDSDHTKCCISKHVERTSAKEKCLAFCKMTPGSSFQADASYLPCWGVLGKIKECFKEAIINGN